jgi:hypothetical protein
MEALIIGLFIGGVIGIVLRIFLLDLLDLAKKEKKNG